MRRYLSHFLNTKLARILKTLRALAYFFCLFRPSNSARSVHNIPVKKPRILIVGMTNSVHLSRWVNQFANDNLEIRVFPSTLCNRAHSDLRDNLVIWPALEAIEVKLNAIGWTLLASFIGRVRMHLYAQFPSIRIAAFLRAVRWYRPDVIHSLEFQAAGYLVLDARMAHRKALPPWIATSWGSDIYLFGRLASHERRIRDLLSACDFYSCECQRDIALARHYGFMGEVLPCIPCSGGFPLEQLEAIRSQCLPSHRTRIMLKGYQSWAGRALVALRALERCAEILGRYQIYIYSAGPDVAIAAELFAKNTGVTVNLVPYGTSHMEMLQLHAHSRISIGLSISDGLPGSFTEALVMGSFPIQSCTACSDEWIENGVNGVIVPPDDPDLVEQAIRCALSDDALVDNAAQVNWLLAQSRLDQKLVHGIARRFYSTALPNSLNDPGTQ